MQCAMYPPAKEFKDGKTQDLTASNSQWDGECRTFFPSVTIYGVPTILIGGIATNKQTKSSDLMNFIMYWWNKIIHKLPL